MGIKLGLDFGTTNCVLRRVAPNGTIPDFDSIPSVMAWKNGEYAFGHHAKDLLSSDDPTIFPIRDIKLKLDKDYIQIGQLRENPIDIATELIRYLIKMFAGEEEIDKVVVGTPVYMSREHRVGLQKAIVSAGINKVKFAYEPTAALNGALDVYKDLKHGIVLVVDWGGGTLDIAAISVEKEMLMELGVEGDVNDLGGSRIDEVITERLLSVNPIVRDRVNRVDGGKERLKEEIEELKIKLLESLEGEDSPSEILVLGWLDEILELKPTLVYDVMRYFAEQAVNRIFAMLQKAKINQDRITHILFAGGTCKCDVVRENIAGAFKNAKKIEPEDPQILTGRGCAKLSFSDFRFELAADFAVKQCDDTLCILLPKGYRIDSGYCRTAEFIVTNAFANEAYFNMGVCHFDADRKTMLSADSSSFISLEQMFIEVGGTRTFIGQKKEIGDKIKVQVSIEDCLTVRIDAHSLRANDKKVTFIPSVPLAIIIG